MDVLKALTRRRRDMTSRYKGSISALTEDRSPLMYHSCMCHQPTRAQNLSMCQVPLEVPFLVAPSKQKPGRGELFPAPGFMHLSTQSLLICMRTCY